MWETGKDKAQARYERWWLGKRCRLPGHHTFRKVVKVEAIGPPSFVYGVVKITFEDGSYHFPGDPYCFKPSKKHVEVEG